MRTVLLLGFLALSCTSANKTEGEHTFQHTYTDQQFDQTLENYSGSDEQYEGLINTFKMHATALNTAVVEAHLWRRGADFKWSQSQYLQERNKAMDDLNRRSEIFLSFFTPNHENSKLVGDKAVWRVYLESDGVRHEGKVVKETSALTELSRLYPHHDRFYTPYLVRFRVPMTTLQQKTAFLVFTGPLGSTRIEFPAVGQGLPH